MARPATRDELDAARRELDEVNRQHGFRRGEQTADRGGSDGPKANESSAVQPPAVNSTQAGTEGGTAGTTPEDPGPPRFLGVDLEHKLAGLSGGGVIPIMDDAVGQIVDILIGQLQLHLARTLGAVADTHKRKLDPAQLEIPFGKPD